MTEPDDIDEAADVAISTLFDQRNEMPHRWVLVADVSLETGERAQYVLASPGSQLVDSIGLLGFGLQLQVVAVGKDED